MSEEAATGVVVSRLVKLDVAKFADLIYGSALEIGYSEHEAAIQGSTSANLNNRAKHLPGGSELHVTRPFTYGEYNDMVRLHELGSVTD